jgi:hypothetical protein
MFTSGSLEHALARMHARLAHRPTAIDWAAIEEAHSLASLLDAARDTTLESLVTALPPSPDARMLDRATRAAWSRTVQEAATWMPREWRAAIAWCGPAAEPDEASHAALLPSLGDPAWRERWPAESRNDPDLVALTHLFTLHLGRFRKAQPHEAAVLRSRFEERLVGAMHRHPTHPVTAFAWLALAAIDLERLRAEIARHVDFDGARIAA